MVPKLAQILTSRYHGYSNSRIIGALMALTKPPKLRTAIRDVYADLRVSGPPTIPDIVEAVSRRYPKLAEKEKSRLFNETIAAWARKILNSDLDVFDRRN